MVKHDQQQEPPTGKRDNVINKHAEETFIPSAVSEIAIKAKTDPEYLLPLWQDVKRFVYKKARAYIGNVTSLYDMDDLMQEGFIALSDAVRTYEPKGMQFTSWLAFYLPRAFRSVAGGKNDATRYIKNTIVEDKSGDEVDLFELIPDETAEKAIAGIADESAAAFLWKQVELLPVGTPKDCFIASLSGKKHNVLASEFQITCDEVRANVDKAARMLRHSPQIRAAYPEYYQFPMRKSLVAFNATWSSVVEDAVLRREQFRKGRYTL